MSYVGATLTHVFTRGADVSLKDVTIAQNWKRGYTVRMTSRTGSAPKILEIWRKWVELRPAPGEDGWLSHARRSQASGLCGECHMCCGGRWKSQNRKIMPLSPYVEKPLNSKVIKSFVPELRSRKCFSYFEIPMFYVYMLWTFHVHFAYSCIWLWYKCNN